MFWYIKKTTKDVFKMYKNFWHFTISKILIFWTWIWYAILMAIPFLLFFLWVFYYFNRLWTISIFGEHFYIVILLAIIFVIAFFLVFSAYSFYYPLLLNLNFSYLKNKKLNYLKNFYFDKKFFFSYIKLFLLNIFIIFSPFIIAGILFLIISMFYGWFWEIQLLIMQNTASSFFNITFVIFLIASLVFLYLIYKTLFAIVIFVDKYKEDKKIKSSLYYIKKSFKLTKWYKKFLRFFSLFFLLIIVSLPIEIPSNFYYNNIGEIKEYNFLKQNPENINDENSKYFFDYLSKQYWNLNQEELKNILYKNYILYGFFQLLHFLFIVWLLEMILVSFYKRQLKK